MWFERGGKVVVSLPGVPYEMEHLMQDEVMPRLKAHFELRQIVHLSLIHISPIRYRATYGKY